jgi:heme/copper-type cytochrome/quinol oxidase subunit 2
MKSSRPSISLLMVLACLCGAALVAIRLAAPPALTVRAVAHQWWWEFDYPSLGIRTSNVLYLPSDTDVNLELVSGDVIHSFWIQGMKDSVDVIPGQPRRLDVMLKSPGELHGNCDSGCGCGTVCMRFRVLARTPRQFRRWASRARLRRASFKLPTRSATPACALDTRHDGHAGGGSPAGALQRLLDGSRTAGTVTR